MIGSQTQYMASSSLLGTNPTTIALAPARWIEEFKTTANLQQRTDVVKLLTDDSTSIFIQDYSYFRSAMGVSPDYEFKSDGRYGCSSVALFHLEPEGKLHPLAITIDYKGSMEKSVTIFNRRIASTTPGDESGDWPWRYAKMCSQSSDWLRHEVVTHLVNTHLVEEVIIVAAHRSIGYSHIVSQLLRPHWSTTLSLNAGARETLVPQNHCSINWLHPETNVRVSKGCVQSIRLDGFLRSRRPKSARFPNRGPGQAQVP